MPKELPRITYAELMKSLDKYKTVGNELTKEQKEFIIQSRNGVKKISWETMAKLWEQVGWGKISASTMRRKFEKL